MTSLDTHRLGRQAMASRLAMSFEPDWVVNLGVGMPTLCSNYPLADKGVILQSENGLIGYGAYAEPGEEDANLVNAGAAYVTMVPGASILSHADSFSIKVNRALYLLSIEIVSTLCHCLLSQQ